MNAIEREAVRTTAMLLATEDWPKLYSKAPVQHAHLIKNQARLHVTLVKFFKGMAAKADDFLNKQHYDYQLAQTKLAKTIPDFSIDVLINDEQIDNWDQLFINVAYQPINEMIGAGAKSGETIYNIPIGIHSTDAIIQDLTTKEVARLVGKKVLKDGSIVDNPNADYDITETMRNDIAAAVKASLALGETSDEAVSRMQNIISDPYRAERIANTEAVQAYNAGVIEYGNQTDAVGKEWEDAGADDECADNAAEGPIDIEDSFGSGDDEPPAHPNCRCAVRLIYQEEWDSINGDDGNTRPDFQSPDDEIADE